MSLRRPEVRNRQERLYYSPEAHADTVGTSFPGSEADHFWIFDLRGTAQMLTGNEQLPHFFRNPDGSLVTTCDVCRQAYKQRRAYQEANRV